MTDSSHPGVSRVVVIGLDGTPYGFLKKEIEAGSLPNLANLIAAGELRRMQSEIPTVSSVAWSSFMTGKNPGEHGIYGFTDRKPGAYDLYFPNYSHLRVETIWDRLSGEGKRCCVLNVPSTYPARPLNGILASGFVAPSLERAVYPREAYDYLSRIGYRVDVDASLAHRDLDAFLEDLYETTKKRREALLRFWSAERWDFFMCVFTGTDRLHHFLWRQYEDNDPVYAAEFLKYYQQVDAIIGEVVDGISDDVALFILSDHGFCSLTRQVYINYLLKERGLMGFRSEQSLSIADLDPAATRAYCMDPGRVYVNLKGREPEGIVSPGSEYEDLLEQLKELLLGLTDPQSGQPMVAAVRTRSDLFHGPLVDLAPDLVVVPHRGYDFKGAMGKAALTDIGPFTGMHTHDDALLFSRGIAIGDGEPSIRDVAGLIERALPPRAF